MACPSCPRTEKLLRIIRLGLLCLVALVVIAVLAVVAINGFDEPLREETRALRYLNEVPAVAPDQNLYLALLGKDAPRGDPPSEFGQLVIDRYEARLQALLEDPTVSIAPVLREGAPRLTFQGDIASFCPKFNEIWAGIEDRKREFSQARTDNRELLERYLALHQLTGYQETATPSPYEPFGFPTRQVRALFLADVAIRLKSNAASDQKGALDDLERDFRIWRLLLRETNSLISKNLAYFYLLGDDLLVADMLADRSVKLDALWPQLDRITTPFEMTDWRLGDALPGDFRRFQTVVDHMETAPLRTWSALAHFGHEAEPFSPPASYWEPLARHFFAKNATDNLRGEDARKAMAYANLNPGELLAARQSYLAWRFTHMNFMNIGILYNPMGKVALSQMTFGADGYVLRGYDAAAVQRVTKLAFEIRRQHVPADQIPGFMQQHPEWSTHPVSGQAYAYNSEAATITVTPVSDRGEFWRFTVPVWTLR